MTGSMLIMQGTAYQLAEAEVEHKHEFLIGESPLIGHWPDF